MPFNQRGKRRLGFRRILPGQESSQELAVAPFSDRAQAEKHPKLTGQAVAGSFTSHREGPLKPRIRCSCYYRRGAHVRDNDSRILRKT